MIGAGVFGWLDPRGVLSTRLADWTARAGARCAVSDGALQLWLWPGAQAATVRAGERVALVHGGLFGESPEQASARIATAAPGCVHRLEGRFIRVLWDGAMRELCLFRDDSSALALYYSTQPGGGIAFSDDLDRLVSSPAAERRIGLRSLHEYLRFLDCSTPNTIYEGVYSTEPGIELMVRPEASPVALPAPAAAPTRVPSDLDSASKELDRLLMAATAKRLPPQGPVVAFLSGGVDSSLIAAIAGDLAPDRVHAFTVGFEESGFDESPAAASIAGHLGLPHRVLRLPLADCLDAFDAWSGAIAYPFADPAAVPSLIAFRAAGELAPLALDGTGADTLVGIMPPRHRRVAARLGTLLPRPVRRVGAVALKSAGPLAGWAPLLDFDDPQELLIRWRGWPRQEIERLCGGPVCLDHTRFYRIYREYPAHRHFDRYSRLMASLPNDRLHESSRLTGLKVRFPFFDADLAVFVRALPLDLRYRPGEPKRILREVLARRVPKPLWDLPKHGFDFPFVDFLALDDYALPRRYLAPERVRDLGLLDPDTVACTLARLQAGERGLAFRVWALVVLLAWVANHSGRPS